MILGTFSIVFGTGGSALISKTIGEGDLVKANRLFSMLTYISLGFGFVVAVLGIVFIRPIAAMLGAEGAMLDDCATYGRIILAVLPAYIYNRSFRASLSQRKSRSLG